MLYSQEQALQLKQQTFAHLLVEERNHLLTLTLNRPEKKNALNPVLFRELSYALNYAHYNHEVWVVVIQAKGDVFCAGADLKAFVGGTSDTTSTIPEPTGEVVLGDVFTSLHKPCIAKVHAPVFAGGFLIICGCTHVISSPNATFSLPEVKRGLYPFQVMQSMLGMMSPRAVLDFCMRAKTADAKEALQLGLVSEIVELENLDAAVLSLADEIMQYSPSAIRLGLEAFDELKNVAEKDRQQFLKGMLGKAVQTEDAAEGIAAFSEKRKPVWKGK
jgi:enoyl-CoA hydratase/carnithine racemase